MNGRLEKETKFYERMDKKVKTLPSIIGEYYISLRANRKSYTSIGVYINNVIHFARFLEGKNISEDFYKTVKISDLEQYFISLETKETTDGDKRMGDDVLQQRWSTLNNFFEFLIKRGYLQTNPIEAVDRPTNNSEKKVTYLSKTEINKLFKAIERNPSKVMAARDSAVIKLDLATGLRVGALVNINLEDIDWDNNVINVIEKRKKIREISIGENTKQILRDWIKVRNEEFGDLDSSALFISQMKQRMSVDTVADILTRYCKEAGIKRITPHKLRATAACMLAKNDIPVKAIAKQLGHNNIATTMKYLDVFNEDIEKTKTILDNLI